MAPKNYISAEFSAKFRRIQRYLKPENVKWRIMLTFGFTNSNFEFSIWRVYERINRYTNESDIVNSKWEMKNDVDIWIHEFEFRRIPPKTLLARTGERTDERTNEFSTNRRMDLVQALPGSILLCFLLLSCLISSHLKRNTTRYHHLSRA